MRHSGFRAQFITFVLAMMADNIEHVISYWRLYQKFYSPALAEDGCGAGLHRDRADGCRPNGGGPVVGVPGAVIVAPGAYPCGGMGRHRVCYPDGRCVMVCNWAPRHLTPSSLETAFGTVL
jgi:hypothetical protein